MDNSWVKVKVCVAVTWQSPKKTQPRCKMLQCESVQWFEQWFNHQSVAVSPSTESSGELGNAKWWQLLLVTPNFFIVSFSCHDPIDHQLTHLAKGPIHKLPQSRCLLRPWLHSETNPLYSPNSNYYIRSPGLCFESLMDVFVFVWEIMGVRSAERVKKFPGIENRATTMLSQCFLLLLFLINASWCNLTLLLF